MLQSKDEALSGHFIVLRDHNNYGGVPDDDEESIISVAEFDNRRSVGDSRWVKADLDQFLSAIRGRCLQFFFGTPKKLTDQLLVMDLAATAGGLGPLSSSSSTSGRTSAHGKYT